MVTSLDAYQSIQRENMNAVRLKEDLKMSTNHYVPMCRWACVNVAVPWTW